MRLSQLMAALALLDWTVERLAKEIGDNAEDLVEVLIMSKRRNVNLFDTGQRSIAIWRAFRREGVKFSKSGEDIGVSILFRGGINAVTDSAINQIERDIKDYEAIGEDAAEYCAILQTSVDGLKALLAKG